jgi:LysR family transcriptional regulator, glycine cleavage system transcriptional activator
LLPTFSADPYLRTKQLVLASTQTTQSIGNYYLVWPEDRVETAALRSFKAWLATQTGENL